MTLRWIVVAVVLSFFVTSLPAEINVKPGVQIENKLAVKNEGGGAVTIPFLAFVPENYDPQGERWPLILFLHGLGESGNGNLEKVKIHGPPKIVKKRKDFPFVVVSPQSPFPEKGRYRTAWKPAQLIQLLDHALQELHVDEDRVYLTGLSMGGFGTWRLAASHPERFAAAVPICGGGIPAWGPQLTTLPIWCFHGGKDNVVKLAESQQMVQAVRQAGGDKIKLTIYPNAGHDSWTETYNNQEVYHWLLSHRRKSS